MLGVRAGPVAEDDHASAIGYGSAAEVTAIDLSRASLAYSLRKAREYGVGNLRHLHGDLLQVDLLPQSFDIVECVGVLVCVRDPAGTVLTIQGWPPGEAPPDYPCQDCPSHRG